MCFPELCFIIIKEIWLCFLINKKDGNNKKNQSEHNKIRAAVKTIFCWAGLMSDNDDSQTKNSIFPLTDESGTNDLFMRLKPKAQQWHNETIFPWLIYSLLMSSGKTMMIFERCLLTQGIPILFHLVLDTKR